MSIIDKALEANRNYAKRYDPKLGKRPAPKIAVITCMDPRLSDLPGILGLPQADIDVIRSGGPTVTEDLLGELARGGFVGPCYCVTGGEMKREMSE